ncbi:hypothetical protein PENTCL1PPCAC_12524 [Pristionchus entomophagus]|uniref:RING-type E3 ubiquitin transferase n=1 Tax=Pristionchus entomophagus TaxID=358040 RepID=A0AAV5T4Y7_9BILA|nr:hypothetical protein PENTCL1PPCAC_12524 [Pristionchus entomophagus]
MRTYVAEVGEIVRAQRRDEEATQQLEGRLSSILNQVLSHREWMRAVPYLAAASKTLYYSATLLSGSQTLGEEYVRLMESSSPHPSTPHWMRRALFVFLHVYAPLFVDRALARAERVLQSPDTERFAGVDIRRNRVARATFTRIVQWLRHSFSSSLSRVHMATFYIFGAYYQLSRRMAGIRFVSFSPNSDLKALKVYRWLGYVTLAEVALSIILWAVAESAKADERRAEKKRGGVRSTVDEEEEEQDEENEKYPACALCASARPPACPPCGHVACWTCLAQIATSDDGPRCPHCRSPFKPQQLVPLLNL